MDLLESDKQHLVRENLQHIEKHRSLQDRVLNILYRVNSWRNNYQKLKNKVKLIYNNCFLIKMMELYIMNIK